MPIVTVQRAKLPPGPKGNLFLGNTFAFMRDPIGFLSRAARDHGNFVWMKLGNLTTYLPIIYGIIHERRASGEGPGDLLSRLVDARDEECNGMTDRQLRDESVALFPAGHETTALVMFSTFYLAAQNPEAEERLISELQHALGGRCPAASDVSNLRNTEWVVREAMRLYPPAYGIAREALADCEIGGCLVPKGTQIYFSQWLVHREPRWFRDPETFRPERWTTTCSNACRAALVFPFATGPRLHWQPFCHDGGRAHSGHDRAAISPEPATRPDSGAPAIDHAPAAQAAPHSRSRSPRRNDHRGQLTINELDAGGLRPITQIRRHRLRQLRRKTQALGCRTGFVGRVGANHR